ncbi:MAG TPA: sensor histidine kinase [Puia sp.]|nr:sensor histidine kinase [Puia sp.]
MATERINDIGFRLILIPFFGIAIPLVTRMIDPHSFSHWMLKLAYIYTIGIAAVIWQGNRYLLFSLRSYFDWFNRPVRKIIALLLAVSFFTIPVCVVLLMGWYQVFNGGRVNWEVVRTATLIIMICVIFITHVYETVFLVKDSESEMLRNAQLERLKAQAELQALKGQIDPHFMFNSLNTLTWLIEEAPPKAKVFNEHLADVYRYILQNRERELVILGEEVGFLYDYFSLLRIRYSEAVRLVLEVDETMFERYLILPISLQVLVENAHKHNEFSLQEPLEIRIWMDGTEKSTGTAARPRLVVRNRLAKKEAIRASPGVGLANLDDRCKLAVGSPLEVVETKTDFTIYLPILPID